mgnify:CR=1 FL=1
MFIIFLNIQFSSTQIEIMNVSHRVCSTSQDTEKAGEDTLKIVEVGKSVANNWRDVCEQKKST